MREPLWLSRRKCDQYHELMLLKDGGLTGYKSQNDLEAALAAPRWAWTYGESDLYKLAAVLTLHLAKGHCYSDANKRTSIIAAIRFLGGNGIDVDVTDADSIAFTLQAANAKTKAEWRAAEKAIAAWLRRSTTK